MNQSVLVVAVGFLACCSSAPYVPSATRPELDCKSTSAAMRAGCSDAIDIDIANLTPVTLAQLSVGESNVDARRSSGGSGGPELDCKSTSAAVRAGCSDAIDIDIANPTPMTLAELSAGQGNVDARRSSGGSGRPELDCKSTSAAVRAGCSDAIDIGITNLTPVTLAELSAGQGNVDARRSTSGGGRKKVTFPPWMRRGKTPGETGRIGFYFLAWYAFEVAYMFNTKALLKVLPLPWAAAASQHGISLLLALVVRLPALGSRKALRKISKSDAVAILPPAILHVAAHMLTVMALKYKRMTNLFFAVTATEPALSAIMSAVFLKSFFRWQVYAALVPVVIGATVATVSRASLSWGSLWIAGGSSAAFSSAAVLAKNVMSNRPGGETMTAHDLYSTITAMSFLLSVPLAVAMEGCKIKGAPDATGGMILKEELPWTVAACGVSHYLRNVMAFHALSAVHPVTHAIGSSMKWVAISTAIVVQFKPAVIPMATLGSAIVISGALLYSLALAIFPDG